MIYTEGDKRGSRMVFERKETIEATQTAERKSFFWTILQGYWFIVPSIYFIFVLPQLSQNSQGVPLSMTDISMMLFQLFNYSMAGNMYLINEQEQSRQGVADKFLKLAMVQQFFIQNIIGMILAFFAWYQLPRRAGAKLEADEQEKMKVKPKTNLIWVLVTTALSFFLASRQFFS